MFIKGSELSQWDKALVGHRGNLLDYAIILNWLSPSLSLSQFLTPLLIFLTKSPWSQNFFFPAYLETSCNNILKFHGYIPIGHELTLRLFFASL